MHTAFWITSFWFCSITSLVGAYPHDRILLRDVSVLTLYQGQWTNGRRSAPIPQLRQVGGCSSTPVVHTVQCYNRGSDGYDAQWECKTEMDKNYKFGWIAVSCEGFDYPTDPYILKGSCGLEYTIEHISGYGGCVRSNRETFISGVVILCVLILICCLVYMCLYPPRHSSSRYHGYY